MEILASTKKPRKVSSVFPIRSVNGTLQMMLIQKIHSGKWGLPKGAVESHLGKKDSALLEAWEEAGLKGKITRSIGKYSYLKGRTGRIQDVSLYEMDVTKVKDRFPESAQRTRQWFPVTKSNIKLLPKPVRKILKAFYDL